MVEPKLSLTLIIPGGIMVSQQEAENKPEEFTEPQQIKFKNSKTKKLEVVTFRTRKAYPARQVLKMSKEAYEGMLEEPTSSKYNKIVGKIKGKTMRVWDTMSEDARIKMHCEKIAHDRNAIEFYYNILGD